jgi:hypothetical protein
MPDRRLVLHVGAMKSGTSYLQARLFANRAVLAERGVAIPGADWRSHVRAVEALQSGDPRRWDALVADVAAHDGTSVVSMEFLAALRPELVRRVLEPLAAVDVEVVVSARDLNRSIPAMWQETVQNGRRWTWPEFVEGVRSQRPQHRDPSITSSAGTHFWRYQNLVRIVRAWSNAAGRDHVTLVTVPPPGASAELLWERFAGCLRTDPGGFEPAPPVNESLGAASAVALCRLNELLHEVESPLLPDDPLRKRVLAKRVLAGRRGQEPPIGLAVAPWVAEHAAEMVARLREIGPRLVGAWSDLTPVDVAGTDPASIPEAEVTDAALAGVAGLLAELATRRGA